MLSEIFLTFPPFLVMIRTAVVLEHEGNTDDSEWIISLIPEKYPDIAAGSLEHHLERERQRYGFTSSSKSLNTDKGVTEDTFRFQTYPGVFHLKLDRL